MSYKRDIDKRSISITFHISDSSLFEKITYDLFNFIKLISTKDNKKIPLKYTPSILSTLDNKGSKEGNYTNRDPHIHALAVLGQLVSHGDCIKIMDKIKCYLEDHPNVDRRSVYITMFENRSKSSIVYQLLNIIDYNRKKLLGDDRPVLILPHNEIMGADNDNQSTIMKTRLEKNIESISNDFKDKTKHHLYFSKQAM